MTSPWIVLAPLGFVAFGGLAMMLTEAFAKKAAELAVVTTTILFAAAGLSFALFFLDTPTAPEMVANYLAYDGMAFYLDMVICGGAALAVLLAGGYLREHQIERGEFYVVLLFTVFGAMALGRAIDLLSIFVSLETLSLGVYGLVAFRRHSPRAAEGALKYFLLGSFASAILLFGMALLYGATQSTGIHAISERIASGEVDSRLVVLSMLLFTVGLAFKVSAVPFHMWTPDAYEGAATPVTTFMAVVVKAAVVGVLLRIFFVCFGHEELANAQGGWVPALTALAAITLVVGNIAALIQKSVKRMLAYSSISHAGFILVGIVAAWKTGGDGAQLSTVLFYLLAYTVSNVLAFGALILVGSRGKEAVSYEDLAGVGRRHPMVAVPFVVGILSLMGFPPTAGFFAKYYVILAAVEAGGSMTYLAVLAVLCSVVGAYYYLRVLVFMFMREPAEGNPTAVPMRSGYVTAALVLSGYFVIWMGVSPDSYLEMAVQAVSGLVS